MKRINKLRVFSSVLLIAICLITFACGGDKLEKNTEYTDSLKLESAYEGKSFINEGIGKVILTQNVDGDTAHFKDPVAGVNFTSRFLMINTPESTGKIDPWGKKASKYVANILSNAYEIVCESEIVGKPAEKDTTGKRYLTYVWYRNSGNEDFRLLNLEIVEECYSRFTDDIEAGKYAQIFQKANDKCEQLALGVFGQKDPDFDYSYTVNELSIAYLREHFEDYSGNGAKLKVTVRVVRINGSNLYVEDYEKTENDETGEYDTAGIYLFSGYNSPFGRAKLGDVFTFQCQCVSNDTYGNQLTNPIEITRVASGEELQIREFSGNEKIDLEKLEGLVIKIGKVRIEEVNNPNEEGAYTIRVSTASGQSFNVRIDAATTPRFDYYQVVVGEERVLIGGVSRYSDSFQIMLCNQQKGGENDFVLFEQK